MVAPFFFGGRHPVGRLLVVCLCTIAAVAWFVGQAAKHRGTWSRSGALALVFGAVALVGFQLLALPQEWMDRLAPRVSELLPLWSSDPTHTVALGRWETLSLYPEVTKLAFATLVAYALLFVTAVQRIRTGKDVERILHWIALSAVIMACFGLIQYFLTNGRFFWFYTHPFTNTSSEVKGSFTCRNHLAHFLVLGLAALTACLVRKVPERGSRNRKLPAPRSRQSSPAASQAVVTGLQLAGTVVVVVAILLSRSRGGALALTTAALVLALAYVRLRLVSLGECAMAMGVVVAVACVVLSVHGYDRVASRLDDFTDGSVESLDQSSGRRTIWAANLEAIRAGWQTGTGAGTHRYIYPAYLAKSIPVEYTHAENGYLQIFTEDGLPGFVLLVAGLLCCGAWCVRAVRRSTHRTQKAAAGAVAAALAASMMHSLVDFVWFVPACMTLTILFAASAFRLAQLTEEDKPVAESQRALSRPVWIGIATATTLGGIWAVGSLVGPAQASLAWDRFLLASEAHNVMANRQLNRGVNSEFESSEDEQGLVTAMVADLQHVVRCHEADCRAQLRLAENYLRQFHLLQLHASNQMSISQIRGAAMASGFTSAQELKSWLAKAFGQNSELLYRAHYHARRAVQLCPLEGQTYVILAKLCFLEGKQSSAVDAYLEQAMRTNPHDSSILFEAGIERMNLGEVQLALECWKPLFETACSQCFRVADLLAERLRVADMLQMFQPDWKTVCFIWKRYQQVDDPEQKQAIVSYARQVAQQQTNRLSPEKASDVWRRLASMQVTLEQDEAAMESLAKGYHLDPDNLRLRGLLGRTLLRLGRPEEAELHLRWCLARQPDNATLQRALLEAAKVRVSHAPKDQPHRQ